MIAWPPEYGETGVMIFLINYDGVLYEKCLGSDTDKVIDEINSFEPGEGFGFAQKKHSNLNIKEYQ